MPRIFMHVYAWSALAITLAGLAAMLIAPPASMRADRDGVAYFTPKAIDPENGKAVDMSVLVRHYRGD